MKRIAYVLISLAAAGIGLAGSGHAATSKDARACHSGIDLDRTRVAALSDATKKAEASVHLKAAYVDLEQQKFSDCLSKLKAAEALLN